MYTPYLGDQAQYFTLTRQQGQLKQKLNDLMSESTTGLPVDTAKHLSGNLAPLSTLETSLAQLNGYATINATMSAQTDAMQGALDAISKQSSAVSNTLLIAGMGGAASSIASVGNDAEQAFRTAMGVMNTRFANRSVFAGQNTANPAVASADTVLSDLTAATAGATTLQQVTDALDAYFADGGTYDTAIYQGGAALAPMQIAQDETAQIDVRANDPAVKKTLEGLAMGALLTQGVLGNDPVAQAQLAKKSGEMIQSNATDMALLAGRLGTVQARLADADTRNKAESTSTQMALSNLVSVDQYEATTKLQATQTQLEALYAVTARVAQMHLTNYL